MPRISQSLRTCQSELYETRGRFIPTAFYGTDIDKAEAQWRSPYVPSLILLNSFRLNIVLEACIKSRQPN